MKLQFCNKAQIYSVDHKFICNADVLGDVGETATLRLRELVDEFLTTEVSVRFLDDLKGMVYCTCYITRYEELFDDHLDMVVGMAECEVVSQDNVVQRRQDVKVPTRIETTADFLDGDNKLKSADILILDISAGGFFCASLQEWKEGQIFSANVLDDPSPFDCQILRVQKRDLYDDSFTNGELPFGYGCKFINLSGSKEAELRKYVYHEELRIRHSRR